MTLGSTRLRKSIYPNAGLKELCGRAHARQENSEYRENLRNALNLISINKFPPKPGEAHPLHLAENQGATSGSSTRCNEVAPVAEIHSYHKAGKLNGIDGN